MRGAPAEVVASWPAPNYVNPENRGMALLVTELIFMPLSMVVVMARMYVRVFLAQFGLDDWLMLAAMVCSSPWPSSQQPPLRFGLTKNRFTSGR
jgi:hypothetical protein